MKKTFWMLLSAALAMVSTTSCSKDETAESTIETIEATVEVSEEVDGWTGSRSLIYDTEDGGIELWWGTAEAIGVYGSNLTNKKFTGTNKYKNAATTTFSGATLFSSPKYAYYPYSTDNNKNKQTAVKGNLPTVQTYSTTIRRLNYDYKIGTYASWSLSGSKFTFSNMMTYVRPRINATGSVLVGDKVEYIAMEVTTADGKPRQIVGDFTFDLTQSAANAITGWTTTDDSNKAKLSFSNTPTLQADQLTEGFLTLGPNIKKGDVIKFTIKTDKHIATFNRTSGLDYTANKLVKYTINLTEIADLKIENIGEEQPEDPEQPEESDAELVINSFKFTVANNPGKILPRTFTHNSSFTVTTSTVNEVVCEVNNETRTIKAYIPYLNNRTLVPTFELPEGILMITYDGNQIKSGETAVDFVANKQIAIGTSNDNMAIYDIELTNTGLPVVVVNQLSGTTSTESNSKYTKASNAWYKATGTEWQPKDSDWSMEEGDSFMIYNADGTSALKDKNGNVVNEPILASTRIRGNVTQQMPKKSFAVKLDSKSAVLDMPAHKRWVLLANWKDRTLMRNEVAFEVAKAFKTVYPNDGMAWNPSGQHVELVYNGVHVGTYYLCEQIKIDKNRLNINEPYDKDDAYSGNAGDYGILMESDDGYDEAWQFTTRARIPFLFKDDGTNEMLSYASTFVQSIEDELNDKNFSGAYANMDITSFVDFLLVQDLMMNSELKHPKSCYSYINNGKLYAGPVWDFDWNTLPTSSSYSEDSYSFTKSIVANGSFSYQRSAQSKPSTSDKNYIWYPRLMENNEFMSVAAERWAAVQGQLNQVLNHIDEVKAQIAKSAAENEKMWPVDSGKNGTFNVWSTQRYSKYGIGGGFCGDEGQTFDNAVSTLKSTIQTRINGLNSVYKK